MADKSLETELLDLKTQVAENEKTIQDLSDVVRRQGEEIDKLKAEMGVLGREILLMTEGEAEPHRGT